MHWLSQVVGPDSVNVAQLGVAGLMGALWWWERRYSREREEQLTAAHEAILGQREHLQALLDALQGNTAVISHFTEVLRVLREQDTTGDGVAREGTAGKGVTVKLSDVV